MSHKSKENVNELERPLSKRKKKSAFDPCYVYDVYDLSTSSPLTVSQPRSSTSNQLKSTSNSKRLKQSFSTQSRHSPKDYSQHERQKSSGNLSNAVKSTLKCLSKNSKQKQVQMKQKSNEKSCPHTTDTPSPSMSNFCQVSCNKLTTEPKRSIVGQLTFVDTFRNIEEQQTLINQKDSSTVKKKPKGCKIKEDSPKSIEKDQSQFQRDGTREVTAKDLKLDDNNPQTNNANVVLQPPKEIKTLYTSRLLDGRIKITRKIKHDKTVQKESSDTNESDITKQIEKQIINDDVINIKNEAQVSPKLCGAGVQTDLPTRDAGSQTIFPDVISESASSVKELRRRILELEVELEENLTQLKKMSEPIAAMCQQEIDIHERCHELPSTLLQGPFNQLAANLTTVRSQNIPSSSSIHGIKHTLQALATAPQPMSLPQLPALRPLSTNLDSRGKAASNSFIPRPQSCTTSMCVTRPHTPFMIVPQQLMVRPNVEENSFQQVLSPYQSSISHQQRYTHPLQLSALSTHQNQTWDEEHCCRKQNCAYGQCFQQQQLSLYLQSESQSSSTLIEKSLQYQSLHQNESAHQLLRQQRPANTYDQQHLHQQHLLQQNLYRERLTQQQLAQRHMMMQCIETERLKMVRLEQESQEYVSRTNHVQRQ